MHKNEKPVAETTGRINYLNQKPTMNKDTSKQSEFQFNSPQTRQSLLESTKLSRLPKLPTRSDFELSSGAPTRTAVIVCVGCGGRLDDDDNFQKSVKVCRKCLAHYAKIDSAIDEASKRKRRELLEKFAAVEVKR